MNVKRLEIGQTFGKINEQELTNMKVLYIGHYREGGDGWAQSARDNILALDSVGIDVVCRAIKINNSNDKLPDRIFELENKSIDGADICIQHVLPPYMAYNSKVKNVGLIVSETNTTKYSWRHKYALMDQLWSPNSECVINSIDDNIPSCLVPYPSDLSKYEYKKKIKLPHEGNYKFYTISSFNKRKNLLALLRAFHTEFQPNEPVDLVIKTSVPKEEMDKLVQSVKGSLKLRPLDSYNQEIVINSRLDDEQIWGLHNACDCYVSTAYNEAWCIPLFDAIGFGNCVLSNKHDGALDFVPPQYHVNGTKTNCFNMNNTFPDLYTGYEEWTDISVPHLRTMMRWAYKNRPSIDCDLSKYSYESVGKIMKGFLEQL